MIVSFASAYWDSFGGTVDNSNYVCLSDLHLGARYSLLSKDKSSETPAKADANKPARSPSLELLVKGLRHLVPQVYKEEGKPTLILLGDCFDFDFGSINDIADAFRELIELIYPEDGEALFAKEIIYIPGNHDHHIWQISKNQLFVELYNKGKAKRELYHSTELFDTGYLPSDFLNQLCPRKDVRINLKYPNVGIRFPSRPNAIHPKRQIILHHGHFVESTYRLMTAINHIIYQTQDFADSLLGNNSKIDILESENGSWIDFLWSSLGSSTNQRENAIFLFNIMQDPGESKRFAKRMADLLCDYVYQKLYISPDKTIIGHTTFKDLVTGAIDVTLGRYFQLERMSFKKVLSDSSLQGLQWYLSNPVLDQLRRETDVQQEVSEHTSFIFGHTHKAFQDQVVVPKFSLPVDVYNTGGWVVDLPEMNKTIGSAAMFVDRELNIASLRLYQQPINGVSTPVHAQGTGTLTDVDNPLLGRMNDVLQQDVMKQIWSEFEQQIQTDIQLRAKQLREQFFDPSDETGLPQDGQLWERAGK